MCDAVTEIKTFEDIKLLVIYFLHTKYSVHIIL